MKITLNNPSLSKSITEQTELLWNLHYLKIRNALIFLGVVALVLLLTGISNGDNYSMINTGEKKVYYNLNLFTSLGIASILVLLYVIRQVFKSKKSVLANGYEMAKKFEGIDEISYEFTDEAIIIDRKIHKEQIQWNLFSSKNYHDAFIFLNFSKNAKDGIAIDRRLFSESDFKAIKEIVEQRVK